MRPRLRGGVVAGTRGRRRDHQDREDQRRGGYRSHLSGYASLERDAARASRDFPGGAPAAGAAGFVAAASTRTRFLWAGGAAAAGG